MLNEVNNVIMIIHTKEANNMTTRVAVTGVGAISPVGLDSNESWNSIKKGKLGISKINSFDSSNLQFILQMKLKDFCQKKN